MITVKLQGGIGNQMFQYAAGRALALKQSSTLELDTSWYAKSKNRKFELDKFNIKAEIKKHGIVNRIIEKFSNTNQKIITEKSQFFDPEILKSADGSVFSGYWQSETYFKEIESLIKKEFTLKHPLSAEARKWTEKISSVQSVSVHIRRGDYLWNKHQKIHGILPIEYYNQAVESFGAKTTHPIFFIFSDDITWAKEHLKLSYPTEFVSNNNISALEEMTLMSNCKHNIIANSSFSWWGAWLNRNDQKIIIAPKDWFADTTKDSSDIVPQGWIRI